MRTEQQQFDIVMKRNVNKKTKKIAGKDKSPKKVNSVMRRAIPVSYADNRLASLGSDIVVSNREMVTSFSTTGAAGLNPLGVSAFTPGYDINPGSQLTFPWLAHIAVAYEKYRFEKLVFELVPRNSTTTVGAYMMCVDYDFDDPVPTSAAQVMANLGAISGDMFSVKTLTVDCKRMNEGMPWRYVESLKRVNDASRMVYGGYWYGAAVNTAVSTAADLFVSYKVRLALPSLHTQDSDICCTLLPETQCPAGTRRAMPTLPKLGQIQAVNIGTSDCPTLGSFLTGTAYKIGAGSRGVLQMMADLATAGSAPNSYATDTSFNCEVFDVNGNSIGSAAVTDIFPGAQTRQGAKVDAEWAVVDKPGRASWAIYLDKLRQKYLNAAYLVPFVYSVGGRVLTAAVSQLGASFREL